MKLESFHDDEDKRCYKIVRRDDFTDVPGEIITADEKTGECMLKVGGEVKRLSFGEGAIVIVARSAREMSLLARPLLSPGACLGLPLAKAVGQA